MSFTYSKDSNHDYLVALFEEKGASFQTTAMVGRGCPDGYVGYRGYTIPVEFKTDTGQVRESQKEWQENFNSQAYVVRNNYDVDYLLAILDILSDIKGINIL